VVSLPLIPGPAVAMFGAATFLYFLLVSVARPRWQVDTLKAIGLLRRRSPQPSAAQLQPTYAPGLRLHGVAMGGTPANLQAVAANLNGSAFFAFLGGAALGFNAAYPSQHLLSDLTAAGRAALAKLDTMCREQALATYAGKKIQDYTIGHINPH
jgi:hypothetical protein